MAGYIYWTALFWIGATLLICGLADAGLDLAREQTISSLLRETPGMLIWPIVVTVLFWVLLVIHLFVIK